METTKKKGICELCGSKTGPRRIRCDSCLVPDMTLAEAKYTKHHKSSGWALVRGRARALSPESPCSNCGYDKHTEVCHVKDISSFSEDTLVSVVNDPSNLVRLCPNCHWEFDHGLLEIRGVMKAKLPEKPTCKNCGETTWSKLATFCKNCVVIPKKTKISWPSCDELQEMLKETNYIQVAKKLGVSDNSIRKRLRNHCCTS